MLNLSGANLAAANLRGAHLYGATLIEANLSGANLTGANLSGADLSGAQLNEAYLSRANLSGADLSKATLTGAYLGETIFANCSLDSAAGLDTCRHLSASTIEHRTLTKSGPLPLAFLRGCGLPDRLIDYLPSLLNQAVQFYSCFISYSTKDQSFADRLHADLQNKGVRCWFAPHDIQGGKKIHEQIDEAIRVYRPIAADSLRAQHEQRVGEDGDRQGAQAGTAGKPPDAVSNTSGRFRHAPRLGMF